MAAGLHSDWHWTNQYHIPGVLNHHNHLGRPLERHYLGGAPPSIHPIQRFGQGRRHHGTDIGSDPGAKPSTDLLPRPWALLGRQSEASRAEATNQIPASDRLGTQSQRPFAHVRRNVVVVTLEGHASKP